jgi:DNA repair protein SbcC/Rad50
MRPIKLVIQAFGPFADRQEIDFNPLKSGGLLLIHGPTGSGKTSVLDAMSFALYGEPSGIDRRNDWFRSQFARPDQPTFVVFEFSIANKNYRVTRHPSYTRAKKNGTGTTTSPAKATLHRLIENEETLIESRTKRVSDAVEDLLGLSSKEFRQVIVLPQGEFRKLLSASSSDRQRILETLFKTQVYSRIQEQLRSAALTSIDELKEIRTKRLGLEEQLDLEDQTDLLALIEFRQSSLKQLNIAQKKLKNEFELKSKSFFDAQIIDEIFEELERLQSAFSLLQEQEINFAKEKDHFEQVKKSIELKDIYQKYAESLQRRNSTEQSLLNAKEQLLEQKIIHAESKKAVQLNSAGKEAEKVLLKQRETLQLDLPLTIELTSINQIASRLKNSCESKQIEIDSTVINLKEGQKDILNVGSYLEKIKLQQSSASVIRTWLKEIALLQGLIESKEKNSKLCLALDRKVKSLEKNRNDLKNKIRTTENRIDEFRKKRDLAGASILAASLRENQPCPVCGSKNHPDPQIKSADYPDMSEIENQLELQTDLKQKEEELDSGLIVVKTEMAARTAFLEKSKTGLDEFVLPADELPKIIHDKLEEFNIQSLISDPALITKVLDSLEGVINEISGLSNEIDELQQKILLLRDTCIGNEKLLVDLNLQLKGDCARLEMSNEKSGELLTQISSNETDPEILKHKIATLDEELADFKLRASRAEKELAESGEKLRDTQTSILEREKNRELAETEFQKSKIEWINRYTDAGFHTEQDWNKALESVDGLNSFQVRSANFANELRDTQSRILSCEKKIQTNQKPDLRVLQALVTTAREDLDIVIGLIAADEEKLLQLKQISNLIDKLDSELELKEKKHSRLYDLAQIVSGKNELNLNLQNFVLSVLLDDVLIVAGRIMKRLSKGRYILRRATKVVDGRKLSGLDLEVDDNNTGQSRDVNSLSGGEGFQAALSLALGLAEVVQSNFGATRLDTIFIDEGFGSLDQEALDEAINMLMKLQAGGRIVGVVSHVRELQQRIDNRLSLIPGSRGSMAVLTVAGC